jgi:hypothetical protein
MRRFAWSVILLSLTGCGGGKPVATLSVACGEATQLYGATSIEVAGQGQSGHPTLVYPDPVNYGKTGTIVVQPGERCTITPAITSGK